MNEIDILLNKILKIKHDYSIEWLYTEYKLFYINLNYCSSHCDTPSLLYFRWQTFYSASAQPTPTPYTILCVASDVACCLTMGNFIDLPNSYIRF